VTEKFYLKTSFKKQEHSKKTPLAFIA